MMPAVSVGGHTDTAHNPTARCVKWETPPSWARFVTENPTSSVVGGSQAVITEYARE